MIIVPQIIVNLEICSLCLTDKVHFFYFLSDYFQNMLYHLQIYVQSL